MRYSVCKEKVKIEGHTVFTYGVKAYDKGIMIKHISDVSLNYHAVKNLVSDLNEYKVDIIHLEDVIKDFYSDNY